MTHYDKETNDLISCKVQSMQLPEQLGEIDHIFCDKTGTLTQNELEVKALSIGSTVCKGETRAELNTAIAETAEPNAIINLFQCFCLCNQMRVETDTTTGRSIYDGVSQDEKIFLLLAQESQFIELVNRDQFSLTLRDKRNSGGCNLVFKIIRNIPFTVERKKQTMVVKSPIDSKIYIFTKGAEEAIYPLLVPESLQTVETKTQQRNLDEFAEEGLRTLVFAMRVLETSPEFSELEVQKMAESGIEKDLLLLGTSGLSDKLQEDVKACINDFIDAGIKVWILTGDKDSTARSVGYQCGILDRDRDLLQLSIEDVKDSAKKETLIAKILAGSCDRDIMISGTALEVLMSAIKEIDDSTQ